MFKGKITEINDHTFVIPGERNTPSQYTETTGELGRCCVHTYEYGSDIQSLAQNLQDTIIETLRDIDIDKDDATDKRI